VGIASYLLDKYILDRLDIHSHLKLFSTRLLGKLDFRKSITTVPGVAGHTGALQRAPESSESARINLAKVKISDRESDSLQ
jgi:hypothetical protein